MQPQRFWEFVLLFFASWAGSSMVEQLTLNQRVGGSSPPRLTTFRLRNAYLDGLSLDRPRSFYRGSSIFGYSASPAVTIDASALGDLRPNASPCSALIQHLAR